jgi:hypothetical protein
MRVTPTRTALIGLVTALLLAGCTATPDPGTTEHAKVRGDKAPKQEFADKSGSQLFADGTAAVLRSPAVQVTFATTTWSGDMVVSDDRGCSGELTSDHPVSFVSDQETFWVNADDAYWSAHDLPEVGARAAGRWAAMPVEAAGSLGLPLPCSVSALENLTSPSDGPWTKGDVVEVSGTEAVELTGGSDDAPKQVWVSTTPPHPVVQMTFEDGTASFGVLDDWEPTLPTDAVDVTDLVP